MKTSVRDDLDAFTKLARNRDVWKDFRRSLTSRVVRRDRLYFFFFDSRFFNIRFAESFTKVILKRLIKKLLRTKVSQP